MIASLTGTVASIMPNVVMVVGGVGLAVQTTPGTRARLRIGDTATLHTSLVVREDSLTLFGFETDDERELFEVLQTASGVGPKVAQAVLTVHTPDGVRRAIATEDLTALCLVPGIGRKGAQRLVLELQGKMGLPVSSTPAASIAWRDTLTDALTGLGWTQSQADEVVVRLAADTPDAAMADVPALLKRALAMMAR